MDRMAYGGDFNALLAAAKNRESIFDGEKNEQFASAGTRRARTAAARQMDVFEAQGLDGLDSTELGVDASVLKHDVLAPAADTSWARGASRRSEHAVGVGARRPVYAPSFEFDQTQTSSDDYEMGI